MGCLESKPDRKDGYLAPQHPPRAASPHAARDSRLSVSSTNAMDKLHILGLEVERMEGAARQVAGQLACGDLTGGAGIACKLQMRQAAASLEKLQFEGVDGVVTAELGETGRAEARVARKALNARCEVLRVEIERLHDELSLSAAAGGADPPPAVGDVGVLGEGS